MADFDTFLPTLLGFEGGYVNDPADPGGETNKGITLATFRTCSQRLLNLVASSANLKALTDEQAGTIYKALYWDAVHGDEITLQELANIVCDFYVNAGSHATMLLQNLLNRAGAAVGVDGKIGPATMAALAQTDQKEIYRAYKSGRMAYYTRLATEHPALRKFLKGWLNRVNQFPDL